MIIKIGDVKKEETRKGDTKTSTTPTSTDSVENPINQRITTLNTFYLARYLLDQKGGFECSTCREEVLGAMLVHIQN